jgi:hypothetical protein
VALLGNSAWSVIAILPLGLSAETLDVAVGSICIRSNLGLARVRRPKPPKVAGLALMRMNIWIILAALLALLAITRYAQQGRDTQRI